MPKSVEPSLADDARQREGGAMFRLSVARKLGLVAVVALILVGGTLFAQLRDLSDAPPSLGDEFVIGLPITVVHEDAKLTASDAAAADLFGGSVALSGDTIVMGARGDDDAGNQSGSAYVFVRSGSTWNEQAKLTASDAEGGDNFGYSVALSGDTAVVGAWIDDHAGGNLAGSAYVFLRSGTSWTEQAKLTASDAEDFDRFGVSVAVSGDTAVVGAHSDGDQFGSAYVFVRNGTSWSEQAKLTASDAATDDEFGRSVALSGDTAVVGSFHDDHAGGPDAGSAYVFVRSGTGWSEQAKLTASDAAGGDEFGLSVALSGDTAVVGAVSDDHAGGTNAGSVYVFLRSGTSWNEQAKLTASDAAASDSFGFAVAFAGDTAVVGARNDDDNGFGSGSAYVFVRSGVLPSHCNCCNGGNGLGCNCQPCEDLVCAADPFCCNELWDELCDLKATTMCTCCTGLCDGVGGSWLEQAKLTASDAAAGDNFGHSVALSGDTAVVGAAIDDHAGGNLAGSAYVFGIPTGDDDEVDLCPDTVIPESVPTNNLGVNRWALVDEDLSFDTTAPPGGGNDPDFEFTLLDTRGCSCEQIIEAWALGWGHTKFGCSTGVMLQWMAAVWNYEMAQPETESQANTGGLKTLDGGVDDSSASGTNSTSDSGVQRPPTRPRRQAPRRDRPGD